MKVRDASISPRPFRQRGSVLDTAAAPRKIGCGRSVSARRRTTLALLALLVVVGSHFGTAAAQEVQESAFDGDVSVQRFNPAPGPRNLLVTRGARQDGRMTWSAGLMVNYGYKPFVVESCLSDSDCESSEATEFEDVFVVENLVTGDLMGSLTILPALQLGARLPVTWVKGQGLTEDGFTEPDGLSAAGLGDMEIEGKYRFLGQPKDPFAAGAGLFVTLPFGVLTAGEGSFVGDRSVGFGARAIGDVKLGNATVIANLVGVWHGTSRVGTTDLGAEFRYGVGAGYQFTPLVQVLVEAYGGTKFSSEAGANTLEALLAGRLTPGSLPLAITAGAGAGVLQGIGAPIVRGLVGAMYVREPSDGDGDGLLDEKDGCPTVAEDFDNYQDADGCPEGDNDEDGIGDTEDRCPDEAEDPDEFEDKDGCPETDNDQDGLPDDNDVCPNEPESKNGYKDEDGCPDEKDSDNDNIPDARDKCPNEPEDTDGFQDEDGCPEPDNDADGVPDNQDECGDEPETVNGFEDEDGCPDEAPPAP